MGIRFNFRVGRFIKSYVPFLHWRDSYYYLQAQGYWVLANWRLFEMTGEALYRDVALTCSEQMLKAQRADGAWEYPNPEWKHRVATAEGTWASLGLLATYRQTRNGRFLDAVLRWHQYLIDEVGFEKLNDELAVNYFAGRRRARVPNNSAFVLRFLADLADATANIAYLEHCKGLLTFLTRAQKATGEFPYMVQGTLAGGRCWEHFQCFQYNAFQCLDLMRYHEITSDSAAQPLILNCLGFLRGGLAEDGHAFYDCGDRHRQVLYHAAAVGAAFAGAQRLDVHDHDALRRNAFAYVMRGQRRDGSFPFSHGEYYLLRDGRSYPRALSMMLFHILLNLQTEG